MGDEEKSLPNGTEFQRQEWSRSRVACGPWEPASLSVLIENEALKSGMSVHACHPGTGEVDAGGSEGQVLPGYITNSVPTGDT